MLFLGRWLFRLWLGVLALPLLAFAVFAATVERITRWSRQPWKTRVADRLLDRDSVVVPSLMKSFTDDFEHTADGPGFSEQQIPKLWGTCRSLAEQLGCPPPDAIHLSVEPGTCMAWESKTADTPVRRHVALSLLDLRLATHDEARAIIAHEIVHAGFGHIRKDYEQQKQDMIMTFAIEGLVFPLSLPVHLCRTVYSIGRARGAHDAEREADRKAAAVVGGNHAASALSRLIVQSHVLQRVFTLVLERALMGERAPTRLAEATVKVYRSHDFPRIRQKAEFDVGLDGAQHPSVPARVANVEQEPNRTGIGGDRSFIDAYPELLIIEEQLTKTYFPDKPEHTRTDASQLRRKALAARLKRR